MTHGSIPCPWEPPRALAPVSEPMNLQLNPTAVPSVARPTVLAIDLIRGLFAIGVLLAHSWDLGVGLGESDDYQRSWWELIITPGTFWVTGFFVLSGFCIALSVFRSISKDTYQVRDYLFARTTRIYPLFLIGLGLAVLAWFCSPDKQNFPGMAFLQTVFNLQNFFEAFPYYEASWSITNEFVYYLVFPLAIALGGKRLFGTTLACLALYGFASVVLIGLVATNKLTTDNWPIAALGITWCFGVFGLWLFCQERIGRSEERVAAVVGLAILTASFCLRTYFHYVEVREMLMIANSIFASLGFALMLLWMRNVRFPTTGFWARLATWMGLLSYPLYLFHGAVLGLLAGAIIRFDLDISRAGIVAVAVVLSLVFAGTLGVALEKFFLGMRKQWMGRAKSSSPSNPARAATMVKS